MSRKNKLRQFIGLDTFSNDFWHLLGASSLAFVLAYALQMYLFSNFSTALIPIGPAIAAYFAREADEEFLLLFPLPKDTTYDRKELMIRGALVATLAALPFILAFLAFSYIF